MPDPKTLKLGDRIRILRVPENDLQPRERELAAMTEMAEWTADSIERTAFVRQHSKRRSLLRASVSFV